jgi:hypothetical protein
MPSELEDQFKEFLLASAKECIRIGYRPSDFIQMVHKQGGVEAVRSLLCSTGVSTGFQRLWERHRLDLTVEAQILLPEWRSLFSRKERDIARARLAEYKYEVEHDVPEDDDASTPIGAGVPAVAEPNGGMYGVKLIYPDHLRYSHLCDTFPEGDPRKTLMNFKNTPRNLTLAKRIPTGHRALVFTQQHIVWAIEFIGPVDDGSLLAAHGVTPTWPTSEWSVHRPIRFLAKMNVDADTYERGMHRHEIESKSGVTRRSYGSGHFYISGDEYRRMFDVVAWDWTDGQPALPANTIAPPIRQASVSITTPHFVLPPFDDAESFLAHIKSISGQPERNMEDAVKDFLLRLGHDKSRIRFQIGHIDVSVDGKQGKPLFVYEVKRSLLNPSARDDALRKGFDYAGRVGARYVVITDADRYEMFDRTLGLDHSSMRCASFQLTALTADALPLLDLLRADD